MVERPNQEPLRRMLVNGILWAAHVDVPEKGAPCALPAADAKAMIDSHPQAAHKALETIGPLTDNPELAIHIQKILWNMQLKGK